MRMMVCDACLETVRRPRLWRRDECPECAAGLDRLEQTTEGAAAHEALHFTRAGEQIRDIMAGGGRGGRR